MDSVGHWCLLARAIRHEVEAMFSFIEVYNIIDQKLSSLTNGTNDGQRWALVPASQGSPTRGRGDALLDRVIEYS